MPNATSPARQRQHTRKVLERWDVWDLFDGRLEDAIQRLSGFPHDAYADLDEGFDTYHINVCRNIPETDEEYEKRIALLDKNAAKLRERRRKQKAKKEEQELEEYMRLKKKFEGKQ